MVGRQPDPRDLGKRGERIPKNLLSSFSFCPEIGRKTVGQNRQAKRADAPARPSESPHYPRRGYIGLYPHLKNEGCRDMMDLKTDL